MKYKYTIETVELLSEKLMMEIFGEVPKRIGPPNHGVDTILLRKEYDTNLRKGTIPYEKPVGALSKEEKLTYLLAYARSRAKLFEREYNLAPWDLKPPTNCKYLGVKLKYELGTGHHPNAASIDRIDNTKGYTKDNTQIISVKANRLKNRLTEEQFYAYLERYLRRNPNGSVTTIKNNLALKRIQGELFNDSVV